MLNIKFERYYNLQNGLIADFGSDNVSLDFRKGSRIFIVMELTAYTDEEDLYAIPCKVIAVEYEEVLGSILSQEIVMEEIEYDKKN